MIATLALLLAAGPAGLANGDFEAGSFAGWKADPTWVIARDTRGYYSGWHGKCWAWSGGNGEKATGVLRSRPFTLNRDGVKLLITGWNSLSGLGLPRKWNYVSLNLEDGTELDRVYAPNTTSFVPAFLDGSPHRGARVYVKAVDDADEATYSMLGIDDARQADMPAYMKLPVGRPASLDGRRSVRIESIGCRLEFRRSDGALTRMLDKRNGRDLILEPRLGESFRFALTIPGRESWQTIEANWIRGRDQRPPAITTSPGKAVLRWKGPLRNYLGMPYDVDVEETVTASPDGARFALKIRNRTKLPVGETAFPVVGGVQGLGTTRTQLKATELVRPSGAAGFAETGIFRTFDSASWLGDHGPEQYYACPGDLREPWIGFSCPKTADGVLFGASPAAGRTLVFDLQLLPSGTGTVREDGNWPRPNELQGMPCGVEVSVVDVKGGEPGRDYEAAPAFVQFVHGAGPAMAVTFARRR